MEEGSQERRNSDGVVEFMGVQSTSNWEKEIGKLGFCYRLSFRISLKNYWLIDTLGIVTKASTACSTKLVRTIKKALR